MWNLSTTPGSALRTVLEPLELRASWTPPPDGAGLASASAFIAVEVTLSDVAVHMQDDDVVDSLALRAMTTRVGAARPDHGESAPPSVAGSPFPVAVSTPAPGSRTQSQDGATSAGASLEGSGATPGGLQWTLVAPRASVKVAAGRDALHVAIRDVQVQGTTSTRVTPAPVPLLTATVGAFSSDVRTTPPQTPWCAPQRYSPSRARFGGGGGGWGRVPRTQLHTLGTSSEEAMPIQAVVTTSTTDTGQPFLRYVIVRSHRPPSPPPSL